MKRRASLTPILALFLTISPAGCRNPEKSDSAEAPPATNGSIEFVEDVRIVHLWGEPYEIGWAHGVLLHDEILSGLESAKAVFTEAFLENVIASDDVVNRLEETLSPDHILELQGMYDALGGEVTWDRLLLNNVQMYLLYNYVFHYVPSGDRCSSFVAFGDATTDGGVVATRNLDWLELLMPSNFPTVFAIRPDGAIPFVSVGAPGMIGVTTGMNAVGLTAADHVAQAESPSLDGLPVEFAVRTVLERSASLSEAESFLVDWSPPEGAIIAVFDETGGFAAERAPGASAIRRPDDRGRLWLTNHFLSPELTAVGTTAADDESSDKRFRRLEQLLDAYDGEISPEFAARIMGDHTDPDSGNEEDPATSDGTIAKSDNLQSVVYRPAERQMWAAIGPPPAATTVDYVGLDLGVLFDESAGGHPAPISNPYLTEGSSERANPVQPLRRKPGR